MYGILLSTGGPNSVRDSESSFRPPRTTVPPSGTATVVPTVMVLFTGSWIICVNTIGLVVPGPIWLLGKIGTTIGNSCTGPGTGTLKVGLSDMRTKRRSPEITACKVSWTPVVTGVTVGVNSTRPFCTVAVTLVTNGAASWT